MDINIVAWLLAGALASSSEISPVVCDEVEGLSEFLGREVTERSTLDHINVKMAIYFLPITRTYLANMACSYFQCFIGTAHRVV